MTIAATRTFEFDLDGIVRQAFRRAALANEHTVLSTAQKGDAMEKLELIVDDLATEGLLERSVLFETVTLADGDDTYSLATSTLDVIGVGTVPDGVTMGPVTRDQLQVLQQATGATGSPSSYFVDRSTVPVSVVFWPAPSADDDGDVVTFQVQRLSADNQTGTATPDLERYFANYLVWQLAHDLAVSAGRDVSACGYLDRQAASRLEKCKPQAKRRGPGRIMLSSPTQWSGR
jgi:hypothetical protein